MFCQITKFQITKFILLFAAITFSFGCAIKGSGKKSIDFKYWSVDHAIQFNKEPQKTEFGTAQITSFSVSERKSILGTDSWNVNVELIFSNESQQPLDLNKTLTALLSPKNSTGLATTPRPLSTGAEFTIDKSKKPILLVLNAKSKGKVALGYSLGSSELVNQPIQIQIGKSTIIVK